MILSKSRAKREVCGLVKFVLAVAYHFCLKLPALFSQPGNGLIVQPCTMSRKKAAAGVLCFTPGMGKAFVFTPFAHPPSRFCVIKRVCPALQQRASTAVSMRLPGSLSLTHKGVDVCLSTPYICSTAQVHNCNALDDVGTCLNASWSAII